MDVSGNPATQADGPAALVALLIEALERADSLGFDIAAAHINQAIQLVQRAG